MADGAATVTLNRPDVLNAFNDEMLRALSDALKQAERDAGARAVLITGAGRAFCAGQDLGEIQRRRGEGGGQVSFAEHLRATYHPVVMRIRTMEKPVLAGINGVAAGAGASLALACDLRIASDKATLALAFSRVGLVPDSGMTFFLTRLLGYARAFELAATGGRLSAEEAQRIGLVNRVAPSEGFGEAAVAWARELAQGPTRALGLTKRAMNRALVTDLEGALEYEAWSQELAGRSADHREGVAAFMEKRAAKFEGR